ncbi:RNA 2'-phosphotransferase [Verminephrobacter aporrectodeae]|uniref:RNA 2'-phosphotransferase n=1 Tax=Verminephrobacter aporrectodeae TaxID=1110389 RepID=UPI000237817C|nr:RNA 2'-phosphotransferase [Verminephrobacter aporrectodeae]
MNDIQLSKRLSFVLRHKPDSIGLTLNPHGWANVDELIAKARAAGMQLGHEDLLRLVQSSDKQRFTLSVDGLNIRAAQGHSVSIDLGLPPKTPPALLYHGTAARFLDSILSEGLKPQARQQVHLSLEDTTAQHVGARHGVPVVLKIEALRMHEEGFKFFLADNSVWLTDHVPPEFLAPSSSNADSATTSRQPKLST